MDGRLFAGALAKFAAGVVVIGLLLFLPAGSLDWWQGWLFMGILFVPMFVAGLVMMAKAPDLLRKRLDAKEGESEQKAVLALSALMFVAAFVVAGLGFRFSWPQLPAWASRMPRGWHPAHMLDRHRDAHHPERHLLLLPGLGHLADTCCRHDDPPRIASMISERSSQWLSNLSG